MIRITPQMRILVAVEAVDGRKGIDSLARLCREKLQARPHGPSAVAGLGAALRAPDLFPGTFLDPERFRGTCYRAANWVLMGRTTGRGKDDQTGRPNRSIKEVWGYPLTPRFRQRLQEMDGCDPR